MTQAIYKTKHLIWGLASSFRGFMYGHHGSKAAGGQARFWSSSWEDMSEPQTWNMERKAWQHWLLKLQSQPQWHTSSKKAAPPNLSGNSPTNREPNIQMQEPVGATLAQATMVIPPTVSWSELFTNLIWQEFCPNNKESNEYIVRQYKVLLKSFIFWEIFHYLLLPILKSCS